MIESQSVIEVEAAPSEIGSSDPRQQRRRLLLVIAAAGLCAAAIAAIRVSHHPHAAAHAAMPYSVADDHVDVRKDGPTWGYIQLAQAAVGEPLRPEPVPARVSFDEARAVPIVAPLPGRVDNVAVRLGQQVHEGDHLVSVRSSALVDLSKEIELLRAEESARRSTVERSRALVQLKALPEKELIGAEQDLRQSQLGREGAELKLRSLSVVQGEEGRYWLNAPRAGVVVERDVLMGQEVSPDRGDPLLVIAELDEVIVTADVPESNIVGVRVGQEAGVLPGAAPERAILGRVEYIGEVVDPVRHMVEVRVRVPNPEHVLRPNAFVQVAFDTDGEGHIVIDAAAVVTDDQRAFVFVQDRERPETLQRRPVVAGRQRDGKVEIETGLAPGETYVSKGAILLLNAIDLAS